MCVTFDVSHFDRSPSKLVALRNVESMLVTLEVFHFDKSPWNRVAPKNIPPMFVTFDVEHVLLLETTRPLKKGGGSEQVSTANLMHGRTLRAGPSGAQS